MKTFAIAVLLATYTVAVGVECDFNGDGLCNVSDLSTVNGLYRAGDLEAGVTVDEDSAIFDLTGDGVVDSSDLDQFLINTATFNGFAEPYLRGDTNLNDHVGFGDFTQFSRHFGTGREWNEGNYRGSGVSSFEDFLLLSRNFGKSIPRIGSTQAAESVPEPTSMHALLIASVILLLVQRRSD